MFIDLHNVELMHTPVTLCSGCSPGAGRGGRPVCGDDDLPAPAHGPDHHHHQRPVQTGTSLCVLLSATIALL